MRVLVTGGAGYIGSHTVLQLLKEQHDVLVYDNFSNGSVETLSRIETLTNLPAPYVQGDIRDAQALKQVFSDFRPDAVVHFAGLKAVGESAQIPLEYYTQNVNGSLELLRAMQAHDCRCIIFSSSATVYGSPLYLPYDEQHPLQPVSAYGRTKMFIEEIIRDWTLSWDKASAVLLRYFNPVGADASGLIGEDPRGVPNNLMPFVAQVAVGRRDRLNIWGNDYDTRDGTGERDYIHVHDLAAAHLKALSYASEVTGTEAINIGSGRNYSVLEMVDAFAKASGRDIPYDIQPRREGDVAAMLASVDKAQRLLGWRTELGLDDMCATTWNWQLQNPNGLQSS
jgi:UDP-glucose 4-epimerase